MKRVTALILCAFLLLTPLCSCSKKVNYAKLLPDTVWDNHSVGISIIFEEKGVCTVSNPNSMEKCTYTVDDDKLTINGAISSWSGVVTEDEITIDTMRGIFDRSRERSYYPSGENYGYVITDMSDDPENGNVYDLTFWYGYYQSNFGYLTLGSADILNTLTYTVNLNGGEMINGTISSLEDNRFVLENTSIRLTLTDNGVLLESLDEFGKAYEGSYLKPPR